MLGIHFPGRLGNAVGVQDHDHAAVAEDCVAGIEGNVAQDRRHRLDHDFLGIEHPVDDDAEGVGADLGDDDEHFFVVGDRFRHQGVGGFGRRVLVLAAAVALVGLGRILKAQQLAQRNQRQQPVAQTKHG